MSVESLFEQAFEACGNWCYKLHALLCHGVKETEHVCVEAEPSQWVVAIAVLNITAYGVIHVS